MTRFIKPEDANMKWYLVDAKDMVVGRLASKVASIVRGKTKPTFTPNMDTGDYVVIVNADKVKMTGKRATMKTYFRHSGYPGGVTITSLNEAMNKNPMFVVEHAIKGMLPKNRLGRRLMNKVKVYAGENHPHAAQKPEQISL